MKIYVLYYHDKVKLVTQSVHEVAENSYNNSRDKLQIWENGKLINEIE